MIFKIFSGANLRCTGISWDLRKEQPYLVYDQIDFDVPVGTIGDAFDRFLLKILEMRESCKIILQVFEREPFKNFSVSIKYHQEKS